MPRIEISGIRYDYDIDPDHCPICHHGIEVSRIGSNAIERRESEGNVLQILYRCPRRACQHAFIGTYRQNRNFHRHSPDGPFILRNSAPFRAEDPVIPDEIKKISPGYVEVYSQSLAAEAF